MYLYFLLWQAVAPVHVSGNDKCLDAHSIQDLPAYRAGTTQMATPDFTSSLEPTCGTNLDSKGVWYSFVSDKRRIIRLEYELKIQEVGDSVLSIYTGACGSETLVCKDYVFGSQQWGANNAFAVYEFVSGVDETYRFLLSGATSECIEDERLYEATISQRYICD